MAFLSAFDPPSVSFNLRQRGPAERPKFTLAWWPVAGEPRRMEAWPEFDDGGDMPPGIHAATLAAVVAHFGSGTPQRRHVFRRLEHIYALAKASGHSLNG